MINLQNGSVPVPVDAIEIDKAILDLQTRLTASLSWLSHGYGKTYRNIDVSQGLTVYYPEVFLGNNAYMRVTPDNDKQGQSIILVGNEDILNNDLGQNSFLQYDVSILFTANLKLINSTLLGTEYFQQNLIRDVRNVLQKATVGAFYQITIDSIDRDFTDVWREFNIEEKRGISHAPFTHFRVNCTIVLKEECVTAPFDRCATILNMTTQAEQDCLSSSLGGNCDYNDCSTLLANLTAVTKNTCILPTYDFTDLDVQANVTTQQQTDLQAWLCVPACTGDFKVDDLAHAQQIQYNVNDTVCISDTLYKAVDVGVVSGYAGSPPSFNGSDMYFINTDPDTSVYKHTASGTIPFFGFSSGNSLGYNAFGQLLIENGFIYLETAAGGANNLGTVVKIEIATGVATKLMDFSTTTGYTSYTTSPFGNKDKVIINGKLYLTTLYGGANGSGTVLEIDISTGANTVVHDITTPVNNVGSFVKGFATSYNNTYVLVYENILLTYDTIGQTVTQTVMFTSSQSTARCNDLQVVGTTFYILYNTTPRFIAIDLTTMSVSYNLALDTYGFAVGFTAIMWHDASNNKMFIRSAPGSDITSVELTTQAVIDDPTHDIMSIPANVANSITQVGTDIYITSGSTGNNQQYITKYNLTTKTSTNLVDVQNIGTFVPDGVNFLEVNQSPIYLELC